ncbi:MAG TPA: hypothetical protein VNK43_07105 [Gemmatimonadales bacterium]|nr:hypothetical protein [Gemmatimonadales bacterium]
MTGPEWAPRSLELLEHGRLRAGCAEGVYWRPGPGRMGLTVAGASRELEVTEPRDTLRLRDRSGAVATYARLTESPSCRSVEPPPAPLTFAVSEAPYNYQLAVADLTGDGRPDFSFRSADSLHALDNAGRRLWSAPLRSPHALGTPRLAHAGGATHGVADVDGDGAIELVALDAANRLHVFDGSTGRPERAIALPDPGAERVWAYVAVVDLRGRGDRDAVVQALDASPTSRAAKEVAPSFVGRTLLGWDLEGGTELWRVEQDADTANGLYEGYWGQAHGPFRAADVDGDGRDEVVGGNLVDHDGRVVDLGYPRDWLRIVPGGHVSHLDAVMIGDLRPDLPGLEWVVTEEDWGENGGDWHTTLLSPRGVVWRVETTLFPDGNDREPQNVAPGEFDPGRPGREIWVRSRFPRPREEGGSQHPWVLDPSGRLLAHYATADVLPPDFNTHRRGNREGLEIIGAIDWLGGDRELLVAKARHVEGNVGIFDPLTGRAVWYTPRTGPAVEATLVMAADVVGDAREEVVIHDRRAGAIRVFVNLAPVPASGRRSRWADPLYRRIKQNWNYYSP